MPIGSEIEVIQVFDVLKLQSLRQVWNGCNPLSSNDQIVSWDKKWVLSRLNGEIEESSEKFLSTDGKAIEIEGDGELNRKWLRDAILLIFAEKPLKF